LEHPKSSKTKDMDRILTSPNSEDYVTWNVFRALGRRPVDGWWPELCGLAGAAEIADDPPSVELWRLVLSPRSYEAASRERMARSDNDEWRKRAQIADPVEGRTEVGVTLTGRDYCVFVEAKLSSDISWR